jgi:ribosomal protein L21E
METKTTVEILDRSLTKIAEVRALYPLTESGMVLRYSKELSDYGKCTFRIANDDPIFDTYGDIIIPHKYHVRIKRGNATVWQGAIVDNPERGKNYFEVEAREYLYYLEKILVKRTSKVSFGEFVPTGDIGLHYRIFSTGQMSTAVTNVFNEAKEAFGSSHILANASVGTVENPNYPSNFSTGSGAPLTGAWEFNDDVVLQFDYHNVMYVMKAFGIYGDCDFQLDDNLRFNFKKFLGRKQLGVQFVYGLRGNIVDYNVPRYGSRMANDLTGIATDINGVILHATTRDEPSINEYGLMQTVIPYMDVKDKNALNARQAKEIRFVKTPEESPINIILNEKSYPLGQYDVGDIVSIKIKDKTIDFAQARRIVGYTVNLHNTGREMIAVQTNIPNPEDLE